VTATPRERRGELLGTAMGAAVFGALLGPVLGAVAAETGTSRAFAGVAAFSVALAVWAARMPAAPPQPQPLRTVLPALRERRLLAGLWLMTLPALLFGILVVLVPLRLDDAGWGAAAIGGLWVAAAALEATVGPVLGRLSDRRGRLMPVRAALVASTAVSVALAFVPGKWSLAVLVLAAALAYSAFYAPGMALLADGADHAGLAQTLAFGLMNAAWAAGNAVGPAAGGELAHQFGDAVPYLAAAGLCAATAAALARGRAAAV
jgi:MFS family permease